MFMRVIVNLLNQDPQNFFVKDNGDTVLQNRGILNDREIRKIQEFIKQNYQEMYLKWSEYSIESYYGQKN